MVSRDRVIIEVALNENQMRAANPHVPYSPQEIAEDARACFDAGAAIVHFHGRDPQTGRPLMSDAGVSLAAYRLITETTPLLAYPTYGSMSRVMDYYDIGDPAPQRFNHFTRGAAEGLKFEVGPVDLGAFDGNAFPRPDGSMVPLNAMLLNTGADQIWTSKFWLERRVKPTFALFDTRHVNNLKNVIGWGLAGEQPLIAKLFLNGFGASTVSESRLLLHFLDEMRTLLPAMPSWMPVVGGNDQLPVCALGMALGGHARVGIGDHHYGESGAPTNARLVERAVQLARAIGRDPATPDEAREIWGLSPRAAVPKRATA
jgi:3-keto-5-aminohexanoate cleavage enzyme